MEAKSCARSHSHPVTGSRSRAMIARRRSSALVVSDSITQSIGDSDALSQVRSREEGAFRGTVPHGPASDVVIICIMLNNPCDKPPQGRVDPGLCRHSHPPTKNPHCQSASGCLDNLIDQASDAHANQNTDHRNAVAIDGRPIFGRNLVKCRNAENLYKVDAVGSAAEK